MVRPAPVPCPRVFMIYNPNDTSLGFVAKPEFLKLMEGVKNSVTTMGPRPAIIKEKKHCYLKGLGVLDKNHPNWKDKPVTQYMRNAFITTLQMFPQMLIAKSFPLALTTLGVPYGLPVVAGISLLASTKHILDDIQSGKSTGLSLSAGIGQAIMQVGATAWSMATRGINDPVAGTEQVSLLIYAFCRDTANYFFSLENKSPSPASPQSTVASGFCYVTIMEFMSYCSGKSGELAGSPEIKAAISFLSNVIASTLTEAFDNVNYATFAGSTNKTTPILSCKLRDKKSLSAEGYVKHMGEVFPGRLSLLSTYNEYMDKLKELPEGASKSAGMVLLFILYTMFTGGFLTRHGADADVENPNETNDGRSPEVSFEVIKETSYTRHPCKRPDKTLTVGT